MKSVNFRFNANGKKRNELRDLSRWWGEQKLSADEQSYIPQNAVDFADDNEDEVIGEKIEFRCPVCNAKYIRAYNPKLQKDFWGHIDYLHSDCCYAQKHLILSMISQILFVSSSKKSSKKNDIKNKSSGSNYFGCTKSCRRANYRQGTNKTRIGKWEYSEWH